MSVVRLSETQGSGQPDKGQTGTLQLPKNSDRIFLQNRYGQAPHQSTRNSWVTNDMPKVFEISPNSGVPGLGSAGWNFLRFILAATLSGSKKNVRREKGRVLVSLASSKGKQFNSQALPSIDSSRSPRIHPCLRKKGNRKWTDA